MGTVFVCATPIGNLADISLRLTQILTEAPLIAAEDTRVTETLLRHLSLKKQIISLHKFNEKEQENFLLNHLRSGKSLAIVSDAGTPLISDPGARFLQTCIEQDIPIVPISGPSAIPTFLSASGIDSSQFYFMGFFPKKGMNDFSTLPTSIPIVFFETSKRIQKTIELLSKIEQVDKIILAKELTKKFETFIYGTRETIQEKLTQIPSLKGEWIGLFTLQKQTTPVTLEWISSLKKEGFSAKDIGKICRSLGFSKNEGYKNGLEAH